MFLNFRPIRAGVLAWILSCAVLTPACVSVECDGADVFCDPFALILYRLSVEPDCLVRGESPNAGWIFFSGSATDDEIASRVCGLRDGSAILAGSANDSDAFAQGLAPIVPFAGAATDVHLSFYQADGSGAVRRWAYFGGPGVNYSGPRIAEAADGGFYIAASGNGTFVTSYQGLSPLTSPAGGDEILLMRFGPDFNLLWYTYLGSAGNENVVDVAATDEGGVIVAGTANAAFTVLGAAPLQPYQGGRDVVLFNVNASGSVEWFSFFGAAAGNESVAGLVRLPFEPLFSGRSAANDRFLLAGTSFQDVPAYAGLTPLRAYAGGSDTYALSFDRSGAVSQYAFYGTSGNESSVDVRGMRSGEVFLAASTTTDIPLFAGLSPLTAYAGGSDVWLVRLGVDGSVRSHRFVGSSLNENTGRLTEAANGDLLVGLSLGGDANFGVTPVYPNGGAGDPAVLRINFADEIQALAFYGGTTTESVDLLTPTADGGAIIGGEAPSPGFAPPAGTPILEAHTGTSGDEYYLRAYSDGRTTR